VTLQRLNPADHFTLMMDDQIRRSGLAGNFCALVLQLEGQPDVEALRERVRAFPRRFPRAVARLRRQGRQYAWDGGGDAALPFHLHELDPDSPAGERQLAAIVNAAAAAETAAPLELHLLQGPRHAVLALKWFHPACDAKGIELVLHHLLQDDTAEDGAAAAALEAVLGRSGLWSRLRQGWQAKRNIARLDRRPSILPEHGDGEPGGLVVRLERFDAGQSRRILDQARASTGLTGTALYFIGCAMRALLDAGAADGGEACLVPYAVNLRRSRALYPVFGNQVSFLFAQAGRDTLAHRDRLFEHLKAQNRDAVKAGLDRAMLALMQAGSWLPLARYGDIVRRAPDGRERSSFWFSYTGALEPQPAEVAGCRVTDMYQVSQVTAPPSLGLLVSGFDGRLTVSLNYAANRFAPDWIDALARALRAELLADAAS